MSEERIYKLFKDLLKKRQLTTEDFKDLNAEDVFTLSNMLISQYYRDFELIENIENIKINRQIKRENKMKELEKASKPLVEFMNQYCCPHDVIMVQQGHVELLNGEIGIPTEILD